MKVSRLKILVVLFALYVVLGFYLLVTSRISEQKLIGSFIYEFLSSLYLILVLSGYIFYSLAIAGFVGLIVAIILFLKRKDLEMIALVLSFVFLFCSLIFVRVTVHSEAGLSNLKFGMPFTFVIQSQNISPPLFPWQTRYYAAAENPIKVLWPQLFLSFATVFAVVYSSGYGIRMLIRKV